MTGINSVLIVGHLGRDPEVRQTNDGTKVCTLSVATSEVWRDKSSGEKKERTEWNRIVLWGKTAETAEQYLKKGSLAGFQGSLQTRKWQDQSGQDRYTTEIKCQRLTLMGGRQGGGQNEQPYSADDTPRGSGGGGIATPEPNYNTDLDDTIPF